MTKNAYITALWLTRLHDPALGQQYKALFRLGQLHDFELQMVGLGILGRLGIRRALVDKREDDGIPCYLLYLGRQGADLAPILLVGGRDMRRQQMPRISTAICTFEPRRRLAPS